MSANTLTLLLWLGQLAVNAIGWYILASRQSNKQIVSRLEHLEKYNKRLIGWVFGKFGVDLNGDS